MECSIIVQSKGEMFTVLVDEPDYWRIAESGGTVGVKRDKRTVYAQISFGYKPQPRLHQWLLNPPEGMHVDHKNGNGLDNQRSNLRIVTRSQNMHNQRKTRGSSQFKGVSWFRPYSNWRAYITIDDRRKHLGYFTSEEDAGRAYDTAARAAFGEYACVNFPLDGERSALG